MTDEPAKPVTKDMTNRDMAVRSTAIDFAIRSNCGQTYDNEGRAIIDAQRIISGAKQIEEFIKGEVVKLNLKEGDKKEGWQ